MINGKTFKQHENAMRENIRKIMVSDKAKVVQKQPRYYLEAEVGGLWIVTQLDPESWLYKTGYRSKKAAQKMADHLNSTRTNSVNPTDK